jgi:hypothetical protein
MNKTEMKDYLTGKGFTISSKKTDYGTTHNKIMWGEIAAGYLYDDEVQLYDDTEFKYSSLIAVRYTNPRCLERVDRLILYLKTSERRRERRMRREREKQVRAYFERRKNAVNEIEHFMLAEMC